MTTYKKFYSKYRYSLILLRELVITDFKLRYQNSFLGYLWALLRPLFLFIIIYVFFVVILGIGRGVENWGTALLLGIVLWSFFSEVVSRGLKSVTSSGGIIRKINFPKYIIVIAKSLSAVINLCINLVIVAGFAIYSGIPISGGILLLPLLIFELYIFALGLAFLLGTINVKYRDVGYIWDVASQALFYGSAIMYPINRVVEASYDVAVIMLLNPLAQVIQDARHVIITDTADNTISLTSNVFVIAAPYVITAAVFVVGALYFRSRSPYFAEEV